MGESMRSIIICALLAFSAIGLAEEVVSPEKMAERKTKVIAGIDKHIAALQEFKTCVSAASQKGDIKKCYEKIKAFRQEYRDAAMESKKK